MDLSVCRSECSWALVRCQYHEIGCKAKFLRGEAELHEATSHKRHFECALEALAALKHSHAALKAEICELRRWEEGKRPVAVFKMADFERHRVERRSWFGPGFSTHAGGYRMCLRVEAGGVSPRQSSHVSVFLCLMRGEDDNQLAWPFRGSVTVELLNQARDHTHHRRTVRFESREPDRGNGRVRGGRAVGETGRGWPQFVSLEMLERDPGVERQYLKDDCLFLRIADVEVLESNRPWLTCTL